MLLNALVEDLTANVCNGFFRSKLTFLVFIGGFHYCLRV